MFKITRLESWKAWIIFRIQETLLIPGGDFFNYMQCLLFFLLLVAKFLNFMFCTVSTSGHCDYWGGKIHHCTVAFCRAKKLLSALALHVRIRHKVWGENVKILKNKCISEKSSTSNRVIRVWNYFVGISVSFLVIQCLLPLPHYNKPSYIITFALPPYLPPPHLPLHSDTLINSPSNPNAAV